MGEEICEDLFQLLKDTIKDNIGEYNIEVLNNDKKGEGFVGEMVFVNLVHKKTHDKKCLVVKQEQETVDSDTNYGKGLFLNEIKFYNTIWPILQKFYKTVTKKEMDFVPAICGFSDKSPFKIVLENLNSQGYVTVDKTKPFDEEHWQIIFKTYGIYHAVSMAFREQHKDEYYALVKDLIEIRKHLFVDNQLPANSLIEGVKVAQKLFDEKTDVHILEKLRLYEEMGPKLVRQCINDETGQNVLIHGDCWSNNLMFNYDVSMYFVTLEFFPQHNLLIKLLCMFYLFKTIYMVYFTENKKYYKADIFIVF